MSISRWPRLSSGTRTRRNDAKDGLRVRRERVQVAQVGVRDGEAARPEPLHRAPDRAVGGAPAQDQEVALVGAVDVQRRDVLRDPGDLRVAQDGHPVVVLRVVADVAEDVGLLEPADPVLEARASRGPPTGGRASPGRGGRGRSRPSPCGSGRRFAGGRPGPGSATARRRWRGRRR